MCAYQQADQAATRLLIDKVTPLLLRYFQVQAASRNLAEDLVQDTWLRIHKARHTFRPCEPVLPWIFAIARYVRLDSHRQARRLETREVLVDRLPERAAPGSELAGSTPDFEAMIALLPADQREVIVLLKLSGLSLEEVARATSSSVGSVKQKAHRAYLKLRKLVPRKEKAIEA